MMVFLDARMGLPEPLRRSLSSRGIRICCLGGAVIRVRKVRVVDRTRREANLGEPQIILLTGDNIQGKLWTLGVLLESMSKHELHPVGASVEFGALNIRPRFSMESFRTTLIPYY